MTQRTTVRRRVSSLTFALCLWSGIQVATLSPQATAAEKKAQIEITRQTLECSRFNELATPSLSVEALERAVRKFGSNIPHQQSRDRTNKQLIEQTIQRSACLSALGRSYFLLKRYPQALRFYNRALRASKDYKSLVRRRLVPRLFVAGQSRTVWNWKLYIWPREGMGEVYLATGDYAAAIPLLKEAYSFDIRHHGNAFRRRASRKYGLRTNLGTAYFHLGQLDTAEGYLRRAVELYEKSVDRSRPGPSSAQSDRARAEDFELFLRTHTLLQRILVMKGQPTAALEIAERSRARILVDDILGTIPRLDKALTAAQMQQVAAEREATLVVYSKISAQQLYAWVIPPQGAIGFRPISLQDMNLSIEEAVQTVQKRLRGIEVVAKADPAIDPSTENNPNTGTAPNDEMTPSPKSRPKLAKMQMAYQWFVAPIADLLPEEDDSKLIFVPHQELALLPFAAFADPDGRYLVERYELSQTPSIALLHANPPRDRAYTTSRAPVLIASNPDPMPEGLPSLPGAAKEAGAIADLYAKLYPNVFQLAGAEATERNLKQQVKDLKGFRLLHLATHGIYEPGKEDGAWIALAREGKSRKRNGQLTLREIFQLEIDAELVVLSACDTGRGRITGEGILGLTRAFMRAGAKTVVSSLWRVPDDATADLMVTFHQALLDGSGMSKSAALRQAMLATMDKHPDPINWAAFTVVGDPQ